MSPWFASGLLLLSYSFSGLFPSDIAVDSRETIWILSAAEPVLTRLYPGGEREDVQLSIDGLAGGLAVSPTGRWAVSSPGSGKVLVFDRNDILLREINADNPGDLIFNGLDLWVIDTASGSISVPGSEPVARDCAGRNSRLSAGGGGRVIVSGTRGVFLVEQGVGVSLIASSGSGCFTPEGILLVQGSSVFYLNGDTLFKGVDGTRIASSPSGSTLVIWGGSAPSVLE